MPVEYHSAGCPLYIAPVKSLGTDGTSNRCGNVRSNWCRLVAATYSAGIVGWRIHNGTIEGPLLYYIMNSCDARGAVDTRRRPPSTTQPVAAPAPAPATEQGVCRDGATLTALRAAASFTAVAPPRFALKPRRD